MEAVILATSTITGMGPLLRYRPSCLLNIADKPILFYVMEFLANQGIKTCHLFLSDFANKVEEQIADGRRWGLEIKIYLIRDATLPFEVLAPTAAGWPDENILFGVGDCLPELTADDFKQPALFYLPDNRWTGWGMIPSKILTTLTADTPFEDMPKHLDLIHNKVSDSLSTQSLIDLKKSNEAVLNNTMKHSKLATARMVEPNIWISRAVTMRKTTNIIPPVFVGEHCQLMENVQIGPNAVIERDCIIDKGSTVQHSIVLQKSYVGEGLSVNDCIVDRNTLIDLALDTHIHIRDDFILSSLAAPPWKYYPILFAVRFAALFFLILFSPILLLMFLIYPLKSHTFLKIPSPKNPEKWKTFQWHYFDVPPESSWAYFFHRLAVLFNVLKGEVHFVGVAPRSLNDVLNLPLDRQNLYLKSKVGFITLSNLDNGPGATADEQYASEVYYAVHMSTGFDLRLVGRWISLKCKQAFSYLR